MASESKSKVHEIITKINKSQKQSKKEKTSIAKSRKEEERLLFICLSMIL
jgi:hypothetical protein